jgi:hypothetical protein
VSGSEVSMVKFRLMARYSQSDVDISMSKNTPRIETKISCNCSFTHSLLSLEREFSAIFRRAY